MSIVIGKGAKALAMGKECLSGESEQHALNYTATARKISSWIAK